jgi:mono/diheme cytochrome c family protein
MDSIGEKVMKLSLMMGVLTGLLLFSQIQVASAQGDKALIDKGALLYKSNCIQCHNKDPNLKGSMGPEVVDAPIEVMTSKIMTGAYPAILPAGFVPKRKSKAMRKLPKLQKDIPAIYAWVQSVKKKK